MSELSAYLRCATEAARIAGAYLREQFESEQSYTLKSDFQDLATECDTESEKLIIDHIHRKFPNHSILAEESGAQRNQSEYRWVIDPIDGTTNFAHNLPIFAVSIALEQNGEILIAAMLDPMRDELFTAVTNKGAYVNERPLSVSRAVSLKESVLMAGYPYDMALIDDYLQGFRKASVRSQGVRRLGSAALALAYVAVGRVDGFWTMNVNPWDVAAGVLLVREAGGTITRLDGEPYRLNDKRMIASNGKIHQELIEMLEE